MTTILITGASRGLGAMTARRLAARGATVFAGARNPSTIAAQLQADPETVNLDIRPLELDVTDDQSVDAALSTVGASVDTLDVLINNAGIPGTWAAPQDVEPGDFTRVFETNVFGVARVTRAFLPLLSRGQQPRLVMVSSGMGSLALQSTDEVYRDIAHLPYPAAKAALNMLAVQYAKACPQLLVTSIDPGLTATEFTAHAGHTVEEGSDAIVTAALDTAGPTGRFLDRTGPVPW